MSRGADSSVRMALENLKDDASAVVVELASAALAKLTI
jgi:hypothetical protein